jgi:hypothetical protein
MQERCRGGEIRTTGAEEQELMDLLFLDKVLTHPCLEVLGARTLLLELAALFWRELLTKAAKSDGAESS